MRRVILAGGGTAGHIEPALAVADAIKKIDREIVCEFVGTENGLEKALIPARGYRLHFIPKVTLPRHLTLRSFAFPIQLIRTYLVARKIVKDSRLVIGFGGYVSAPIYLAAKRLQVPIVIHEANARPGFANRLGRTFADVVAVNFETVRSRWPGAILTGMPIRESIASLALKSKAERESFREASAAKYELDPNRPIVAIFGGSQGSKKVNEVIASVVTRIPSEIQIIHSVGRNNPLPPKSKNYLPLPYFEDMASIYGCADLLVTRSGAVTCSELMTLSKFAILVPLPHGNGEQSDNAADLVKAGLAISVPDSEFTDDWLVAQLPLALKRAQGLSSLSLRDSALINCGAATRIAELALAEVAK